MNTQNSAEIEPAERLKQAVIDCLVDAYEDAGIRGLCGEGRFEIAVDAVRGLDFRQLLEPERAATEQPEIAPGRV